MHCVCECPFYCTGKGWPLVFVDAKNETSLLKWHRKIGDVSIDSCGLVVVGWWVKVWEVRSGCCHSGAVYLWLYNTWFQSRPVLPRCANKKSGLKNQQNNITEVGAQGPTASELWRYIISEDWWRYKAFFSILLDIHTNMIKQLNHWKYSFSKYYLRKWARVVKIRASPAENLFVYSCQYI